MIFGALVVILIIVSALLVILPVLRKPQAEESTQRDQQNIEIARDKKNTLEQQLADEQMTQAEYDAALRDLETSLAIDLERQQAMRSNQDAGRWAIWVFSALIPLLSFYLYWQLGAYQVIENPQLAKAQSPHSQQQTGGQAGQKAPPIEELVERVKNHLRENPEDARGWFMLGRTYLSLKQYSESVTALERAYELVPDEPGVMLALADALAMIHEGNMSGRPERLVKEALNILPKDPTALWLAGLAAEQAGRNREAFDHWTALLPLLDQDPQSAMEVRALLTQLKQKQPDLPEFETTLPTIASASEASVTMSIALAPSFSEQVNGDDLVFVYAKAASGPPMPLAAKRLKVSDLPLQVTLADSDAMMAQMKLSGFDQVVVGARVSKSGNPVAQAGDLFVESAPFNHRNDSSVLQLEINQVKQ